MLLRSSSENWMSVAPMNCDCVEMMQNGELLILCRNATAYSNVMHSGCIRIDPLLQTSLNASILYLICKLLKKLHL